MKLLLFWIKEMVEVKKHYANGLLSYFMHKLGVIISPSLIIFGRGIDTYKYDYYLWKHNKKVFKWR
ncbi:hypothetical protein AB3H50_28750 [Bacillus pacificus]|uniref:hypothetical protein n=1 Tax=Bacillus pacificus TaxID=2026187 RepID=UPI000937081C